ncbi:palmdelphin, partial [Pelobates cultripes]
MEEAELMKERLLAITDKRRLQEDIAQRRLTIEEEKLKLHHLKKKSLREKWLLDGLSTMSPEEQEETLRQSQADQKQIKSLELSIVRLEQEIGDLEKEESQLSAKEVRVLQRLKSVERTTEDIIK